MAARIVLCRSILAVLTLRLICGHANPLQIKKSLQDCSDIGQLYEWSNNIYDARSRGNGERLDREKAGAPIQANPSTHKHVKSTDSEITSQTRSRSRSNPIPIIYPDEQSRAIARRSHSSNWLATLYEADNHDVPVGSPAFGKKKFMGNYVCSTSDRDQSVCQVDAQLSPVVSHSEHFIFEMSLDPRTLDALMRRRAQQQPPSNLDPEPSTQKAEDFIDSENEEFEEYRRQRAMMRQQKYLSLLDEYAQSDLKEDSDFEGTRGADCYSLEEDADFFGQSWDGCAAVPVSESLRNF